MPFCARLLKDEDIPQLLQKLFDKYDEDNNQVFTKGEFPNVVKTLVKFVEGETPSTDDIEDLFNLLDVNGDENIDHKELMSLLTTFFKVLREKDIEVEIKNETDLTL